MASDGGKPGGFSLSLGGPGKKPGRRLVDVQGGGSDAPVREEVLGFGADGGLKTAAAPGPKRGPLLITKQENSYRHAQDAGRGLQAALPARVLHERKRCAGGSGGAGSHVTLAPQPARFVAATAATLCPAPQGGLQVHAQLHPRGLRQGGHRRDKQV